ncbi:MAG TPA: alpha/beta hydrolase [Thermoanaerobaculia bacterium]|nr:alpha/beta hydrolase [Thermoanaerobaculia bacterium]
MRRFFAFLAVVLTTTSVAAMTSSPALSAAPSHYVTVDGIRVHYKITGKGRNTLVFVHGLGGEMNVWREQVEYFAPKARVLVLDLPGYGQSDKPQHVKYTMRLFARAIRATMDDAKVDRAIVVGHSMGVAVMREFDRAFPTRVRGLVSVDGAMVMNLPRAEAEKFIEPMRGADYQTNLSAMFDAFTEHESPPVRMDIKSAALSTPQHVIVSSMEEMFAPAVWKDDKITIPLLIVNTSSPMWTAKYVDAVRALAHDLKYTTIDDADHFIMFSQPAALNQAIEKWMKSKGWLR